MLAFAIGLITMGLGHWAQLVSTPWVNDNDVLPKDHAILWPVLVAVVLPAIITWAVWRKGEEDLMQLRLTGNEVGVIPDGMTLDEWRVKTVPVTLWRCYLLQNSRNSDGGRNAVWTTMRRPCDNGWN